MKKCPKCGKEVLDTAKFCGGCGYKFEAAVETEDEKAKITCPKCGAKLKKGAKFCGKCGTAIAPESQVQSQQTASDGAAEPVLQTRNDFSLIGGYIHWNVLPGQIAVKIDENDIAAYGKVKGVSVQDGVKALFFVQGKLIAELDAGNYSFKEMGTEEFTPSRTVKAQNPTTEEKAKKKKNLFGRFVSAIADHLPGKHKERAAAAGLTTRIPANVPPVNVVLIRSTEFPFVFDFKNIGTANIRSDVGISFLCKINNINEFYANQLIDRKFICFDTISKAVEPVVANIVSQSLAAISPDKIEANEGLQSQVLSQITAKLSTIYEYLTVTKLITLSSKNEDLEVIRRKREELYISELELAELSRRNDFLNRLKDEENNQILREATTQVEFEAAMEQIDERHEMNMEEREKFRMLLETQKKIRIAKNDDELEAALWEFKKNKLLRDEEFDNLEFQINHNRTFRDMDEAQALALATMNNDLILAKAKSQNEFDLKKLNAINDYELRKLQQHNENDLSRSQVQDETEIDRLKLQREMEVGNARIQNELNRQRMQDEYTDARRQADFDFEQKQDEADFQMMMRKMEFAQSIKRNENNIEQDNQDRINAREQSNLDRANQRELDLRESARKDAAQKFSHEEDMAEKYATMSVEQIMAVNPNLTEAAAQAMKAKYEAEAEARKAEAEARAMVEQNGKIEEKNQQMMQMMQQMMENMNAGNQQNIQNLNTMSQQNNANMQQLMQYMAQMASNGMNAAANGMNAANTAKIEAAQNEAAIYQNQAAMTNENANANQDRFLQGMQTTIQSVGGAMKQPNVVYQQAPASPIVTETPKTIKTCPKCGTANDPDNMCCTECGTGL